MKSPVIGTVFIRIVLFLLGLMMVMPAVNKLYTYCSYRYLGEMVYGTVNDPSSGRDIGGRPFIQYKDTLGGVHEFKSRAKTHLFVRPKEGEKMRVFLHGSDPRKAIVDNLLYYVVLPLIFLAAGCYCCLQALLGRFGLPQEKQVLPAEEMASHRW